MLVAEKREKEFVGWVFHNRDCPAPNGYVERNEALLAYGKTLELVNFKGNRAENLGNPNPTKPTERKPSWIISLDLDWLLSEVTEAFINGQNLWLALREEPVALGKNPSARMYH